MPYYTKTSQEKRKLRVRGKMRGTASKPRISVNRSNKHIYVQAVDDVSATTIVMVSDAQVIKTKDQKKENKLTKTQKADLVGQNLGKLLVDKKIFEAVFDRGQYRYHGRVKKVADAIRQAGVKF